MSVPRSTQPIAIRLRYRVAGAHVHVRLFSAPATATTYAHNGDLVFGVDQWEHVRAAGERAGFEFVPEDERP